jgi:tRNA (cmo5U34)-methyltransferase
MSGQLFDFDSDFAARYDQFVRRTIFGYEQLFPLALSLLSAGLSERAHVLVVGAGTGAELAAFGSRMAGWTFTGVDPSQPMIQQAQVRVESLGMQERVRLWQGYVDDLPPGETFDAATLILVLHFVPDDGAKLAMLRGIATRLKPGASLVLLDLSSEPDEQRSQILQAGWKNFMLHMGMPRDVVDNLPSQAALNQHFIPPARAEELLREAGFARAQRFYSVLLHTGWIAQKD